MSGSSSEVHPGERIGRYTVVRRLAVGGMAEVYLARHEGPKGFAKWVVIKRVLPGLEATQNFTAMFLDEGRLAARLSHPGIAQTFELGEHENGFFLVMEYVAGESLNRLVKRAALDSKPIPAGSALRVAMQVLEALDYAHDLKGDNGDWLRVVHRDVSPTNVVITYHGAVKLLDFGIAHAESHQSHTEIGTVKGKGGYMAPEQASGAPVDQRTDIYAVGSLLYLLTTGAGPFDGHEDVFAMIRAAVEGRFPKPSERNPAVNPQLEQIILKAMSLNADDRYPTAGLMLAALEEHAVSRRLFPSPRELTMYMRQLFPDRIELARSYDEAPDEAVVAKMAESFSDAVGGEIVSAPTRLARRPISKANALPALSPPSQSLSSVKSQWPIVKSLKSQAKLVPLGAAPGPTTLVASMRAGEPAGFVGAVPALSQASERATQETDAVLSSGDFEDKTVGIAFVGVTAPPSGPASTVSSEMDQTGPSLASTGSETLDVGADPAEIRTSSLPNMASVGNLVAQNAWAFVVAGLAAVLLGVMLLWALSGD